MDAQYSTIGVDKTQGDPSVSTSTRQSSCTCSIMFTAGKKTVARNPECSVHREVR